MLRLALTISLVFLSHTCLAKGMAMAIDTLYHQGLVSVEGRDDSFGFSGYGGRLSYWPAYFGKSVVFKVGLHAEGATMVNSFAETQWSTGLTGQESMDYMGAGAGMGLAFALSRTSYLTWDVRGSLGQLAFTQTGHTPGSQVYRQTAVLGTALSLELGQLHRTSRWVIGLRGELGRWQATGGAATERGDVNALEVDVGSVGIGLIRRMR